MNPEPRIAVQVKSKTSASQIVKYCKDEQLKLHEKLFFVFHIPERAEMLGSGYMPDKLEIVDGYRLATLLLTRFLFIG